ncbi:30308_t:CDS:2, partial [Gigaspora margarita]
EFILVIINDDEEESVKTMNYNNVNKVTANSVREKNMNEGSHEIEQFRKKSLFLWQENDH